MTATTSTPARALIRDQLLASLQRRILSEAAGELIPTGARLLGAPHRDQVWLGQLSGEPQLVADISRGLTGDRLVPAAEGFSFQLANSTTAALFEVELSFCVYVTLHPSFEEQRAFLDADQHTPTNPSSQAARTGASPQGRPLATVWTKVPVGPVPVRVRIDVEDSGALRFGEAEITAAVNAAVATAVRAVGQPYRARRKTRPAGSLPRDADMYDDAAWTSYTTGNLLAAVDAALPRFVVTIDVDVTASDAGKDVLMTVVNATPADEAQFADRAGTDNLDRPHLDTHLYEVRLSARTDAALWPHTLEQVARSHRYDRTVEAFGQASPVEVSVDGSTTTLRTAYGAVAETGRVHPRTIAADGRRIDVTFESLIANPTGTVNALVDAHSTWVEANWSVGALRSLRADRGWDDAAADAAAADARAARDENTWLRAGAQALVDNADLREAFVLANRAMREVAAAKGYDSWWLFQIAWIIGCLPAVVDPAVDLDVQIETVPPGGGKSEAYLGVTLTHLFYARLRGGTAGVSVWARFPLRLLSAQQTHRFTQAVLAAEVLRKRDPRISGGDPFGVGFFVGGTNTPNRVYPAESQYSRGLDPHSPKLADRCRILERCPICTQPVTVRFDERTWTMQHVCANTNCPLTGVLPVWVIDDDIYRNAPAVLVGTVDKLAQMGHADQFKILFGRVHSRCPRHGYTANPSFCAVFGCNENRTPARDGFGHLRCEITDELHLLDESLGALDGMYETLLQQIGESLGNPPLHILGATATLEGYREQVRQLYRRDGARRFPAPGPDAEENFFSRVRTDDPLRRYVGVRPRRTTMVTASADVARIHAAWLAAAVADPAAAATAAGLDASDPDVLREVTAAVEDDLAVLLAYCLRNEDLSSFIRDDRVRELLDSEDNLAKISGSVDPAEIREAVARLDTPPADPARRIRIVAATRAIGHGFDSPRLNVMVLMGTPAQAAEVIQATARVGRAHPGLVIHVFNPSRDRDSSVFRYYAAWIRYLDRLVTKVPVNRESLPVLRRALPGALMAYLLQVHNLAWMTSGPRRFSLAKSDQFRNALTAGHLDRKTLVTDLSTGLGLDPANPYHQVHRNEVEQFVDETMSRMTVSADPNRSTAELLDPSVPRSLRDVEEPITIYKNV
ncbi:helicase-related protein [Actinoplanes sp. NPDC026623]|uniref:DEAD/DEAH box helicase family protein n=1 Tax=Actinoplanes sp. NPDC026623 TaxID=3155610 RepID=UPI0033D0ADB9